MGVSRPKKLLVMVRIYALVGVIILVGLSVLVQVYSYYSEFQVQAAHLRAGYLERQKQVIRREVERIVERVEYRRSILKELAREQAQLRVNQALAMAGNLYRLNQGTESEQQVRQRITEALRALRFDQGVGYYFIFDLQGNAVMHPLRPEWKGRNLIELEDQAGQKFVRTVLDSVGATGEGEAIYTFSKPGRDGDAFIKLSYARRFDPYGWAIGTGIYLDDLESREKQSLLAEIQGVRYAKNGYLFVDDWNGVVLAHGAQPDLVGTNIWDFTDSNGVKVVQRLIAAAQTEQGDFVHYSWRKPDTRRERPKVSFAKGIAAWQWMIGTGVYTDDVEADIALLREDLRHLITLGVLRVLAAAALFGLVTYWLLLRWHRYLENDFDQFRRFFEQAAVDGTPIEPSAMRFEEFRRQAGYANRMLADKIAAMLRLEQQQAHLEELVAERTRVLEEKSRELERLATTDALTGLLNRRSFHSQAGRVLREAQRYGLPCCLVIMDVDHFKDVNDEFGHESGDRILRELTERITAGLRASDLFGRWGGEEFVLLLPHADEAAASQLVERLRATVADTPFAEDRHVTASFGISAHFDGEDLETVFKRADAALYEAKHGGRNRLYVHDGGRVRDEA